MQDTLWQVTEGDGPLVALAIHDGHSVRSEVAARLALDDDARLREEDPYTARWTALAPTRIVVSRSRFEVDLNRPRDRAVYREPSDAWGLDLWRSPLPDDLVERSLAQYDEFYATIHDVLERVIRRAGQFVVYDLHSYNHRRDGPDAAPADPDANPQVNLGTGSMDRQRWAPVVDRFVEGLRAWPFPGGGLDVRENVKFRGGHLSRWIHETFPGAGCALAIEFKKFFMDEWTGQPNEEAIDAIGRALTATTTGVLDELPRCSG
ncbi:MAG: N-formylglutamate amidohydrolase [Gemmatimonadota bacterium]|nr:N-formylglutamate amidohydrolase [Gemmatimonadota bacterium]